MFKIIQEKSKTAEFALRYWHDFNDFLPSVNFWTYTITRCKAICYCFFLDL